MTLAEGIEEKGIIVDLIAAAQQRGIPVKRVNRRMMDDLAVASFSSNTLTLLLGAPVIQDPTFFVTQLYLDLLDRSPDPGGLNFWVNLLNSGAQSRAQVASSFFNSS